MDSNRLSPPLYKTKSTPPSKASPQVTMVPKTLLVIQCDKILGPAVIKCKYYIQMVIHDHLSDHNNYECLHKSQAVIAKQCIVNALKSWRKNTTKTSHTMNANTLIDTSNKTSTHLVSSTPPWKSKKPHQKQDLLSQLVEASFKPLPPGLMTNSKLPPKPKLLT